MRQKWERVISGVWLVTALLLIGVSGVIGQEPRPGGASTATALPKAPVEGPAVQTYEILDKHCARCHQHGRLERPEPASGFGKILDLNAVAADPKLVLPGNPDGSRLYTYMLRQFMPYDLYREPTTRVAPTNEEIAVIRTWISQLKSKSAAVQSPSPDRAKSENPAPVLTLRSDKASYTVGDALKVVVRTSANCHLTLISVDTHGRGTVIYPSDFEPQNLLQANQDLQVPATGAPYRFRLKERGRESIVAICNPAGVTVDGIRHDFERQRFTYLGDYAAFLAAGGMKPQAAVAAPRRPRRRLRARAQLPPAETKPVPGQIAHTGVVFDVR